MGGPPVVEFSSGRMIIMAIMMFVAAVRAIDLHVPDAQRQWMRAEGAKHLTTMQNDTVMPLFGVCWRSALDHLDDTCAALTERTQAQLALRFARCFMDMTHGPEPPPPRRRRAASVTALRGNAAYEKADDDSNMDVDEASSTTVWCSRPDDHACMRRLPERHFAAFQQFFAHTAHVCYYVWGQRWHAAAAAQLQELHTASERVGAQMRVAAGVQRTLLGAQRDGMRLQREAAQRAAELGRMLEAGGEEVRRLGGEWRRVAGEQGRVLAAVFGQLHHLHGWLLAETAAARRLLFWLGTAALCALATAVCHRTRSARWPALLLCTGGHWADGGLHSLLAAADDDAAYIAETAVWWLRRAVLLAIAALVAHVARGWRSETQRLADMLVEVRAQNSELLERVRRLELEHQRNAGGGSSRAYEPSSRQSSMVREASVDCGRWTPTMMSGGGGGGVAVGRDHRRSQTPQQLLQQPTSGVMQLRSGAMRQRAASKQ